ncbi:hypothetical protein RRG08_017418 [Elysia crispata]|uniref:Uncharacterized protein n=1 Tax=Elysia crispata TaxID=231223 RepID=A0AAE0ZNT0_9GAST|nr:hypothetical protein RRG08_017418 [Elysia crispata]
MLFYETEHCDMMTLNRMPYYNNSNILTPLLVFIADLPRLPKVLQSWLHGFNSLGPEPLRQGLGANPCPTTPGWWQPRAGRESEGVIRVVSPQLP